MLHLGIVVSFLFESFLGIYNGKVTTAFILYLVNNTTSTIFTSVFTFTFYFGSYVTVAFSIEKIFIC